MKYLKAIYAAVFAGLGATGTAYVGGHGHITVVAGIAVATTVLSAFSIVWGVPNAAPAKSYVFTSGTGGTPTSSSNVTWKFAEGPGESSPSTSANPTQPPPAA